jgi:hypothetical protein
MIDSIVAWGDRHPELMIALVWPIVTALVNALFKPRSAEEYAALHPRVAQVLRLVAALGLDPVKAVDALRALVARRRP